MVQVITIVICWTNLSLLQTLKHASHYYFQIYRKQRAGESLKGFKSLVTSLANLKVPW